MEFILLTGGAGYIGSQTYVSLAKAGYRPVILDNFCNAMEDRPTALQEITGLETICYRGDVRDKNLVKEILLKHNIKSVIHFAAFLEVGESTKLPLKYYDNNINGLISVLQAMQEAECPLFLFSGSCTVYGQPEQIPVTEQNPLSYASPYGHSKLICEEIIRESAKANDNLRYAIIRYFNPVGADSSGKIGFYKKEGQIASLFPNICISSLGKLPYLQVFGDDYPTKDGSCIRDYIHVMDLADGHVGAMKYCQDTHKNLTVNLGTGQGYSVFEIIANFERATGQKVPFKVTPRREGDITQIYADPSLAKNLLKWQAKRDLFTMCQDSWNWHKR